MADDCEFEIKRHLILIISIKIQHHVFKAAQIAINFGILSVISSFIPYHVQYALNALDVHFEKNVEQDQGKSIYNHFNFTFCYKFQSSVSKALLMIPFSV